MRKKSGTLLLRLLLIIGSLGTAFLMIIYFSLDNFPIHNKNKLRKQENFGIVLPSHYEIHGIDVSRHQEDIDWKRVDSMNSSGKEITFVFIKATEGISRQDPSFRKNWNSIRKTNLLRGAYHFYYPSRDALKQASNFISYVELKKGDLPPVVDIEHTNGKNRKQIISGLSTFLSKLETEYKVKPIIYTNHTFYTKYLADDFKDNPLWISYYVPEDKFHENCKYRWIFWQHSEKGKVDGISGNVDFNVFSGSMKELRKLCIQ
jgi:lysozyme